MTQSPNISLPVALFKGLRPKQIPKNLFVYVALVFSNNLFNPKMLGIKLFGGQYARPGCIICRQNGTKWRPGKNVGVGSDWTIFSMIEGTIKFDQKGRRINVVPLATATA